VISVPRSRPAPLAVPSPESNLPTQLKIGQPTLLLQPGTQPAVAHPDPAAPTIPPHVFNVVSACSTAKSRDGSMDNMDTCCPNACNSTSQISLFLTRPDQNEKAQIPNLPRNRHGKQVKEMGDAVPLHERCQTRPDQTLQRLVRLVGSVPTTPWALRSHQPDRHQRGTARRGNTETWERGKREWALLARSMPCNVVQSLTGCRCL